MRLFYFLFLFSFCSTSEEHILHETLSKISSFGCSTSNVIENRNIAAYTLVCHRDSGEFLLFSIQSRAHVCDARRIEEQECAKDLSKLSQMPSQRLIEQVEDIEVSEGTYLGKWSDGSLEFTSKGFDEGSLIYSLVTACKQPRWCDSGNNDIDSKLLSDFRKTFQSEVARLKL
ncbi:hypothetical protein SAMN04488051_1206 [Alkalimonas amylolytica]|uniref:Uncharacterized protein n=1 Tax=Alkalimonas amylolytica TaxID=152573 RepID=A0A1H4G5J8_ALKAM|nr:hypothetical protein SAMN04488051_1206 [Alkalimonas amylolytica]